LTKITKILLIEDNPLDALLFRGMLKESGKASYDLTISECLDEAVALLDKKKYDIIILDPGLPDSYELDALRKVVSVSPSVPVVVLTGLNDKKMGLHAVRLGAQDYLVKGWVDGKVLQRVIGYAIERKQAEKELENSERRFREVFDQIPCGYQSLDADGNFIEINQAWQDTLGYSRDEVIGHWFGDFLVPNELETFQVNFPILKKAGGIHTEFWLKCKNGRHKLIAFEGRVANDLKGNFKQTHCILQDITEHKRAEEELKSSEQKYRDLFNNAGVGMFRSRLDGSEILNINQKFADIFGLTREEMVGTSVLKYWADAQERAEASRIIRSQGSLTDFECQVLNARGETRKCLTSVRLDPETGILEGSIIDITERKAAEKAIQASLEEKEVLLKEIQHRVKNNMQVMVSLLQMQSTRVKDPADVKLFKDSQERIRSMALVYERLYQSSDLARINLRKYATDLVNNLVHSYSLGPVNCRTIIDVSDMSVSLDLAIPCGLIINEAISNSLKYAFPDNRPGTVSVGIKVESGAREMFLADDGVGLPDAVIPGRHSSMGIQLIYTLAEHQLGGKVELDRSSGNKYTIVFPLK